MVMTLYISLTLDICIHVDKMRNKRNPWTLLFLILSTCILVGLLEAKPRSQLVWLHFGRMALGIDYPTLTQGTASQA